METENDTKRPKETQKFGFQIPATRMNSNAGNPGQVNSEIDNFYQKLSKLHNPTGLNLVFDLRHTTLDLHLFYKEVTQRGGFIQVTVEEKWGDVASALKLDRTNQQEPRPLMKLYALFLYQYEQLYYYRDPRNAAYAIGHAFYSFGDLSALMGEKCVDNMSQTLENLDDGPAEKKTPMTNRQEMLIGSKSSELNQCHNLKSRNKEMKKHCCSTLKSKGEEMKKRRCSTLSAYHIFLKKESARLKVTHSEKLKGLNFREMAMNAWRYMSESEKQPYIEESKTLKEERLANSSQVLANLGDGTSGEKILKTNRQQMLIGSTSAKQNQCRKVNLKYKNMKKRHRGAPRGNHTAYQIFIKRECERLKSTHSGELKGRDFHEMAINAWRYMSDSEKQPYIEESKRLKKERLATQATEADHEQDRGVLKAETETKIPPSSDNYAALQSDTEKSRIENQASMDFREELT